MKWAYSLLIYIIGLSSFCGQMQQDTVSVLTYNISGKTATGIHTHKIKEPFVAISRDLLKTYPLHSYIKLSDCNWQGLYKVMDVMHSKHKMTVDIFVKGKKKNKQRCVCTTSQ